jgi:ABC-type microcin C transport system permease subunit YejB
MTSRSCSICLQTLRSVGGIVLGYVTLVLASTFDQQTMFGEVSFHHSPTSTLVLAGLLTPVAAVLASLVTAVVAGRAPIWHILPLCLVVCAETIFLYATHKVDDPLWFEAGAAIALVVSALVSAWAVGSSRSHVTYFSAE